MRINKNLLAAALYAAAAGASAQQPLPSLLPSAGTWLKGDTHVHDDHSADGSLLRQTLGQGSPGNLSVAQQLAEAERSGLDYVPLTDHRTYDQHYDPQWESSRMLLLPGEEANGSPHATVLGAVDSVVQGGTPAGSSPLRVVQQSIWDAHAQGASWGTAHPDDGEMNGDGTPNAYASAVGVDTVETWNKASQPDVEIDYAEGRWNRGYRFGVAGACDDHFKELWVGSVDRPGTPATSVHAGRSVRSIVQNLWAGHTRLDSGTAASPAVTLEADLQGRDSEWIGGDEIYAPAGTLGHLHIAVTNGFGNQVLVYRSPGRSAGAFASFRPLSPVPTQEFEIPIVADAEPSWYRVEVRGPGLPAGIDTSVLSDPAKLQQFLVQSLLPNQLRAMTSPVFISTGPVQAQPEVTIPSDLGGADGAKAAIGAIGEFSGFPAIATDSGASHVVAEVHGVGTTAVVYRHVAPGGAMAAPMDLTSATSPQARFPRVAARGQDVWVVWQDERGGEQPHRPAIYLRHSSDGGQSWQAEELVRAIGGRAEHPDIALTADGKPLLVWQEISAGNPFDVMAQELGLDAEPVNLSREGKTIGAANVADTRSARYPASVWPVVAVSPAGVLAVAWQDDRTDLDPLWTGGLNYGKGTDPDNWQIMVVTRAAGASRWNAPASLGADDRADRHPALTFTASGRLVAAWDSKLMQSSGANLSVLAAYSDDGGNRWSAPAPVAENPAAMSQWPRLGRSAAGHAMLVWSDTRSADWRWRVMSSVLTNAGTWGVAKLWPSRGINTWPAVSAGSMVFSSTRNAERPQRDRTQQIFYIARGG